MGIESTRELFSVALFFLCSKSQLELWLAEASSSILPRSRRWTYIRLDIHLVALYGVHLFEFWLGLAEIARNDVYHNLVELGVDVEYVLFVQRFPILLFNGAETQENPRPTARVQNKQQVPPTKKASSAWCLSTFVI